MKTFLMIFNLIVIIKKKFMSGIMTYTLLFKQFSMVKYVSVRILMLILFLYIISVSAYLVMSMIQNIKNVF